MYTNCVNEVVLGNDLYLNHMAVIINNASSPLPLAPPHARDDV